MTDELRARVLEQYGPGIQPRVYREPEIVGPPEPSPRERDEQDARDEKAIVAHADKQMRALGFTVWNLSQPRATKQTPGLCDRIFTHPARGLLVAWEAKSHTGTQRPDQRVFEEHLTACGVAYVCGTDHVLFAWLVAEGVAAWTVGDLLIALPVTPRGG